MREAVALLILFHVVAYVGHTIGSQRKIDRLRAEPRWVHLETPRWLNLPPTDNIEDLRNR